MHVLGRVKHVAPEPVCIGEWRAFFEYAAINATAEVLDEVAVYLGVNIGDHSLGINLNASGGRHRLGSSGPRGGEQCRCKGAAGKRWGGVFFLQLSSKNIVRQKHLRKMFEQSPPFIVPAEQ